MNEKKKQNGSATKEEGRNCDKHVGGEWSNLDKQTRGRRRREGNKMFFGGNENTLVLLLLRFRGKQLLRRFDVSRDESVSLLQLPRPRFFFFFTLLYIFHTTIFYILDNSLCFISVASTRELHPRFLWERKIGRGKLASPKARLIQARERDRGLVSPFTTLYEVDGGTIVSISARSVHRELGIYPSARQRHFDHSLRQCLPRISYLSLRAS